MSIRCRTEIGARLSPGSEPLETARLRVCTSLRACVKEYFHFIFRSGRRWQAMARSHKGTAEESKFEHVYLHLLNNLAAMFEQQVHLSL